MNAFYVDDFLTGADNSNDITTDKGAHWHWAAGTDNPASRGASPEVLAGKDTWWHGPEWFKFSSESWPADFELTNDDLVFEESRIVCLVSPQINLTRGPWHKYKNSTESNFLPTYDSYDKLENVMATVLRAIGKFRQLVRKEPMQTGQLTANVKETARLKLLKLDQQQTLSQEIHDALQRNETEARTN